MVSAAVRRCFSLERTILASISLGRKRSSFSSLRVRASLYVVEMVRPRVLMIACIGSPALRGPSVARRLALLGREAALMRRQDAELLAVLGHGAPRDREPLGVQGRGDVLVREGLAGILGGDEVLNHLLDRHRRHHLARRGGDAAV